MTSAGGIINPAEPGEQPSSTNKDRIHTVIVP